MLTATPTTDPPGVRAVTPPLPVAPVLSPEAVGVSVRTQRPLRCPRCTGTVLIERVGSEQDRDLITAECWRCDALPVHVSIGERGDVRAWIRQDPARKTIDPNRPEK